MKIVTKRPVYFVRKGFIPVKDTDEKCDKTGVNFFTPVSPYTTKNLPGRGGKCVLCECKARFLKTTKLGREDTLITLPKNTPILRPDYSEFESLDEAINALKSFMVYDPSEFESPCNCDQPFVFGDLSREMHNVVLDLYWDAFSPNITFGNLKSHIKAVK